MRALAVGLVVLATACGGGESDGPTSISIAESTTTTATANANEAAVEFVGDERPARLAIPPTWDPAGDPMPLVVLLHGYGASGELQDLYLGTSATGAELGYLTLTPDGSSDPAGRKFWNAGSSLLPVDDAAYLIGLIDEVVAEYNADPGQVFLVGHSNGGFMANKLACETPDRIAGIAAIAGGFLGDNGECAAPMRVLFIQGTDDATVPYAGGEIRGIEVLGGGILGADATVERWRRAGSCGPTSVQEGPFDFDLLVRGDETGITVWGDCESGVAVELWRMEGSGHVPGFLFDFRREVMERLLG